MRLKSLHSQYSEIEYAVPCRLITYQTDPRFFLCPALELYNLSQNNRHLFLRVDIQEKDLQCDRHHKLCNVCLLKIFKNPLNHMDTPSRFTMGFSNSRVDSMRTGVTTRYPDLICMKTIIIRIFLHFFLQRKNRPVVQSKIYKYIKILIIWIAFDTVNKTFQCFFVML